MFYNLHVHYHAGKKRDGFQKLPSPQDKHTVVFSTNEERHQKASDYSGCHHRKASRCYRGK